MKDMYCIVYFSLHLLIVIMVIPENKDCKNYEGFSVMYLIVYFLSHLFTVNGDS